MSHCLKAWTLKALGEASRLCGLTKKSQKDMMYSAMLDLAHQPPPERLISIDLGLKNLALCELHLLPPQKTDPRDASLQAVEVKKWELLPVDFPQVYHPQSYASHLKDFAHAHNLITAASGTSSKDDSVMVLLERQRHRTLGAKSVCETIMRLVFLEIQLHMLLLGQARSILPRTVGAFWSLPMGAKSKKGAAVDVVHRLMSKSRGSFLRFASFEAWTKAKKRDDLADALLQALSFSQWHANARLFIQEGPEAVSRVAESIREITSEH